MILSYTEIESMSKEDVRKLFEDLLVIRGFDLECCECGESVENLVIKDQVNIDKLGGIGILVDEDHTGQQAGMIFECQSCIEYSKMYDTLSKGTCISCGEDAITGNIKNGYNCSFCDAEFKTEEE